jgi:hypothetical protein
VKPLSEQSLRVVRYVVAQHPRVVPRGELRSLFELTDPTFKKRLNNLVQVGYLANDGKIGQRGANYRKGPRDLGAPVSVVPPKPRAPRVVEPSPAEVAAKVRSITQGVWLRVPCSVWDAAAMVAGAAPAQHAPGA